MARQVETISRKITKEGIEVTLLPNTVIKRYSKTYICMAVFSTHKEAKKEFSKYRQGHREL